jgi:acetyl-CoA C-acetyltransferase
VCWFPSTAKKGYAGSATLARKGLGFKHVKGMGSPEVDAEGKPTGNTRTISRDEGLRETTMEKLATLKPVARENGVHTAGNASQISDGAAAVLLMTEERAAELGLRPRARIVDTCLVGVDPVFMLTGPIDATQKLLARTGRHIAS